MKNSYHNTNNEQGVILFESEKKAERQEDVILKLFKQHPDRNFTPEEVQQLLDMTNTPLTSIRRAMSNLANPLKWNALEKTDVMRMGLFGKKVHAWKLK